MTEKDRYGLPSTLSSRCAAHPLLTSWALPSTLSTRQTLPSQDPLPCLPGVRSNTFCVLTEPLQCLTVAFSSSLWRRSPGLSFPPTSPDAPSQSPS